MGSRIESFGGTVSKEEVLKYYKDMLMIRRFEEKAGQLYGMGLIGGFCHLYIGQEAVVVGLEAAAAEGDKRITSYRDHGHMLAAGMEPNGVMAELTGRVGGYSKGQVYETFNMAALWELPVIFVIENNQYAMGTAQNRSTSTRELYTRGEAFGISGEAVDGMNVFAVKESGERAVKHCRAGKGPYILEIKTYRYRGHSMSDPAKYRTREEVQKMREERDAIEQVRSMILTKRYASEEELKAIDKDVKAIVNASAEFAKESPEPTRDELWTDVYA